jgi:hypothetical protein
MGQVAGDQELVQIPHIQVLLERLQHLRSVLEAAFAAPGQVAQGPLVKQVPGAGVLQ